MITQVIWTDVNNRELDNIYARMGDDEIREIQFIICRNDPPEKVEVPAGVSGQFRMIKSSGNFVVRNMTKTVHEDGTVIFTVAVSDQMVNVQGTGYYDIRLSGGGFLYTASGRFIVDTPVISSAVLEDVSEVNGLVFPDDFLTDDDNIPRIDDNIISSSSVWSSYKTNQEISSIDLSDYATKTYVDNAIEQAGGKVVYSSTPQETGEYNGKKVYTVVLDSFTVRSFSGTEYNSRINNIPVASKIISLRILCNYMGYSSVSFPADCFYDNLNNAIQIRGFISPSFGSVTLDAAIIEYVEV